MATDHPTRRRRLPPEVRKNQILDHAAALIREHGVSALNMDRLGREAGVSKPLIYAYFKNRTELLKSLLLREVEASRERNRVVASGATGMEDLVRATSRSMLEHVGERGIIVQQLMHEPDIADVLEELTSESHRGYVRYLAKRVEQEYELPGDLAELVIDIGLGLSAAAGGRYERTKQDVDLIADVLVTMIMGGLRAIARSHQAGDLRAREAGRRQAAE